MLLVLALCMLLSCAPAALAAGTAGESEAGAATAGRGLEKFPKSYDLPKIDPGYDDDDIVRVVVVLEGTPTADFARAGATISAAGGSATANIAKLQAEHTAARTAMRGIIKREVREFTTLLDGFSCDVAYGDIEKLEALENVKGVFVASEYSLPRYSASPLMDSANTMTGNAAAFASGYTGKGTVVAIIDTGLNVDHEAFADADGKAAEGATLHEADIKKAEYPGKYLSAKIPFAYDYADGDTDVTDLVGHGTHVTGIAAGSAYDEENHIYTFRGGAPEAQVLAMKVFSDISETTTSDIYFAALEDAYLLGADVINMSLGSQNGFVYSNELEGEVYGNIYKRLADEGVVLSIAAGNEDNMATNSLKGYIGPDYQDYGVVASPAAYEGNVSVASVNNASAPYNVLEFNGTEYPYLDGSEMKWTDVYEEVPEFEFAVVTDAEGGIALGNPEDFENADVADKVAVLLRGTLSFTEKANNAAEAGALGVIVVNTEDELFSMDTTGAYIPAILVASSTGEALLAAKEGTLTFPAEQKFLESDMGWEMSDFSSWGTSPSLTIDPAVTSVGGDVYSADFSNKMGYVGMSGTSMAAPNMAATFLTVLEYLKENTDLTKTQRAETARALIESTAKVLSDPTFGDEFGVYSVRRQGAGLGVSSAAIDAHKNGAYISDPLKELGDDPTKKGVFTFDVTLKNDGNEAETYDKLSATVMHDLMEDIGGEYANTLTTEELASSVKFTKDGSDVTSVTVPAKDSVTVTVTITLKPETKAELDEIFDYGSYVEGYAEFANADRSVHATYLAYYGDWTKAPVLDRHNSFECLEDETLNYDVYTGVTTVGLGNTYFNMMLLPMGANLLDDSGIAAFDTAHLAFTTPLSNADENYEVDCLYIATSLLRNARHLVMTVTDKTSGEVYYVDDTEYLPKDVFDMYEGWLSTGLYIWDGTDESGNYVPSGTVANVSFTAALPYSRDGKDGTNLGEIWNFDVTVDYETPVIKSVTLDEDAGTLTVTASDENYLQGVYLTSDGSDMLDAAACTLGKGGEFTATFDISDLRESFYSVTVCALDYALNETQEEVTLFEESDEAVSLTLVTPYGTLSETYTVGDRFTFPDFPIEEEGYEFVVWTRTDAENITIGEAGLVDGTYQPGDTITLTRDETFYPLCAVVERLPADKTEFTLNQEELRDFSGMWSFVGLDLSTYSYAPEDVCALGSAGESIFLSEMPDVETTEYLRSFSTNEEGIIYEFAKAGVDEYTIKNVSTGKYVALAADGGEELEYVDTVDDRARWTVELSYIDNANFVILNVSDPDRILCYDFYDQRFAILDETVIYEFADSPWLPSELFAPWMYRASSEEQRLTGYTTRPQVPQIFKDAAADQWFAFYVNYAAQYGLIRGRDDGAFDPYANITRAELWTLLTRFETDPGVGEEVWYSNYQDWVTSTLYDGVNPISDGADPFVRANREQVVTVLWRLAQYFGLDVSAQRDLKEFPDASEVSSWAVEPFEWAVENGIIIGRDGSLYPHAYATRAEVAKIFYKFFELLMF